MLARAVDAVVAELGEPGGVVEHFRGIGAGEDRLVYEYPAALVEFTAAGATFRVLGADTLSKPMPIPVEGDAVEVPAELVDAVAAALADDVDALPPELMLLGTDEEV